LCSFDFDTDFDFDPDPDEWLNLGIEVSIMAADAVHQLASAGKAMTNLIFNFEWLLVSIVPLHT
jgi:hypothetical protein